MNTENIDKKYILNLKNKINRLKEIIEVISDGSSSFRKTSLTIIKKLCANEDISLEYIYYLATKSHEKIQINKSSSELKELSLEGFKSISCLRKGGVNSKVVRSTYENIKNYQDEYRHIVYGTYVRSIKSKHLYILEIALLCYMNKRIDLPYYVYDISKMYTEKYIPNIQNDINYMSVVPLKDIVLFWDELYDKLKSFDFTKTNLIS